MDPACVRVCVPPQGRPLFLQSSRNVSVNVVDGNNQLLTQLVTGEEPPASHTWPPQRTQHSPRSFMIVCSIRRSPDFFFFSLN